MKLVGGRCVHAAEETSQKDMFSDLKAEDSCSCTTPEAFEGFDEGVSRALGAGFEMTLHSTPLASSQIDLLRQSQPLKETRFA